MTSTSSLAAAATAAPTAIPFDNSYAQLPAAFHQAVSPTPVAAPKLIRLNEPLARQLGLDPDVLASPDGVAMLSGNKIAPGSEPIALAYAGHQFGHFVPQLGDGRAVLLGEVVAPNGRRFDLQLKGSGPTRFSRRGDGRAALGPVLREYIVSEAMAALGIPTTRSLAAILSGESVMRERELPGGVLTRVASSHIRVGTFEYFAARGEVQNVRILADYAIARHYPEAAGQPNPYAALLDTVIHRLADLVAQWMLVGFIHGVLNTDNTSIAGETIDYGPCAFMDTYHPDKVFSSIDQYGRYAFSNQPAVIKWNLARFAEALLPLIDADTDKSVAVATAALEHFDERHRRSIESGLRRKLGLSREVEGDVALGRDLLSRMAENEVDFNIAFRALAEAATDDRADANVRRLFANPLAYDEWAARWRQRLRQEDISPEQQRSLMRSVNPAFIPRNHQIEAAIREAEAGNFAPFHGLNEVLARPYDDQPAHVAYALAPQPAEVVRQTFCGT